MFNKKTLATFMLVAVVHAQPALASCTSLICDTVYLERLTAESGALTTNQDVYVQTSGTETGLSCTPDSSVNLKLSGTNPHAKEVYALMMMAFSMDKPVSIRIVSGSSPCEIAYVSIVR